MWCVVHACAALGLFSLAAASCSSSNDSRFATPESTPGGAVPWFVRSVRVDPDATQIPILVYEMACVSGIRADGRVGATVTETESEVVIVVRVVPPPIDAAGCVGNPLTPFVVELSSPLGTRMLLDGRTGQPPASRDNAPPPTVTILRGAVSSPLSVTQAADDFRADFEIECVGGDYTNWKQPPGEFVVSGELLTAGATGLALDTVGWHLVESVDAFGRPLLSFLRFAGGELVAVVSGRPGEVGWVAQGSACTWAAELASEDVPAEFIVPEVEMLPVLDIGSVIARVEGLVVEGMTVRFADPGARCPAWIDLEDALENDGLQVVSIVGRQPGDVVAPGDLSVEMMALVTDDNGNAAALSTTADGLLIIGPAPDAFHPFTPSPDSWLSVCYLDTIIEVR